MSKSTNNTNNCNGITIKGVKCKASASINGYCRWHAECPVCMEKFTKDDKALPCKHWVHKNCIKKSADAMQDLRQDEGYPPLKIASCPICRAPVPEIEPKKPEITLMTTQQVELTSDILQRVYYEWYHQMGATTSTSTTTTTTTSYSPLCFYIWVELCNQYPNYEDPDMLLLAAYVFEDIVFDGSITIPIPPDTEDDEFQNEIDEALDAIEGIAREANVAS